MCGQLKQITCVLVLCLLSALAINAQDKTTKTPPKIIGYTVTLVDGYSFDVDEVPNRARRPGFARETSNGKSRTIKSIKPIVEQPKAEAAKLQKP
jgi:hypothetical protein